MPVKWLLDLIMEKEIPFSVVRSRLAVRPSYYWPFSGSFSPDLLESDALSAPFYATSMIESLKSWYSRWQHQWPLLAELSLIDLLIEQPLSLICGLWQRKHEWLIQNWLMPLSGATQSCHSVSSRKQPLSPKAVIHIWALLYSYASISYRNYSESSYCTMQCLGPDNLILIMGQLNDNLLEEQWNTTQY